MKILTLLILLTLISCNGDSDSSQPESRRESQYGDDCSTSKCLPSYKWFIHSSAVNFPTKFKLLVDTSVIYDSCSPSMEMKITDENSKKVLNFAYHLLPKNFFKVEILDVGVSCDNDAIFYSSETPTYAVAVVEVQGRKFRTVTVTLGN